jgi:hypothetical protein
MKFFDYEIFDKTVSKDKNKIQICDDKTSREEALSKIMDRMCKLEFAHNENYRNMKIAILQIGDGKFKYRLIDEKSFRVFNQDSEEVFHESVEAAVKAAKKDIDKNFLKTVIMIDGPVVVWQNSAKEIRHNFSSKCFISIGDAYEDALFELQKDTRDWEGKKGDDQE